MDLFDSILNFVVPPASMIMMAFAWPTLSFIHGVEWVFKGLYGENMENKVVVITGASSAIGEQIAYEYARRKANLVLVARREHRLFGIRENCRVLGAKQVLIIAADVVKEEDCKRFISDTISYFGQLNHLVNTASLGHTFYFEEASDTSIFPHMMDINFWGNVYPTYVALPYLRQSRGRILVNASVESWLPMPRMSLYAAAKAAVTNFYESLRFEVKDDVGITIATHGWVGSELSSGRIMLEEGAEMQWKEEREVPLTGGHIEEFAKMMVAGACRGDAYVKNPSWYDIFLLYRVFAPDVLGWTFRLLLSTISNQSARRPSLAGVGSRPLLEPAPARKPPLAFSPASPLQQQHQQQKNE
ncbi:11-beta-hydroxysteroid dehydrogenase-like 5 [Ananas comosus]|uniref:11-beta-hydroxysteroid dehydrogenase-like 5 n=1 Tax=Ananas comosus TaxID=4615 RepID=A0A199VY79_ANACO|nr:11-beta-hydroxysteroid dehydrogenase-like 5 [Ananas comosus]